ncbi:Swi3-domain-containing protein [Aspergillus steynii IBT 23096]|uniref:Chromosome segregation in meiosis protein n=1 Tax=Aspergillus steynii IBT 23096 TaxID=1392250 RepID=A0A2I2GCB5_9EURO|nr:Swi3-domain-containing protein [Aspergillus steynii IBT 23096]PLB50523.1 Swi3-domain-containing protein [Aspergillus steynii IBT 23096]
MERRDFPEAPEDHQPGDINDLFDYDVGLDELVLQEPPPSSNTNAPKPSFTPEASGLKLGLDEEVKVTRKRQPVAKLDDNRLLSQAGIPKLRRTAKQKLKFKGKGHEFSDAARLLNFYQLWLDDLFPRAKFVDGLAIIEKLGHSKRLQNMRREWIEEEKPQLQADDAQNEQTITMPGSSKSIQPHLRGDDAQPGFSNHPAPHEPQQGSENCTNAQLPWPRIDFDHELFVSSSNNVPHAPDQDAPDDELEALLNEQEI